MTGYAPNPVSAEEGAASLTSGLLARKGHALPAVDAVAHEGIDMDMAPRQPAAAVRRPVSKPTIATLRPVHGYGRSDGPATIDQAPDAWKISTRDGQVHTRVRSVREKAGQYLLSSPVSAKQRRVQSTTNVRATVTFRMPVEDFVRLHYASRDMNETCQTVILDALSAYFDANDVDLVPQEGAAQEAARLVGAKRNHR